MPSLSHPLQFVLVAVAGWMNQQQRDVIDYLQEENRVLREQLGARRLRFTDHQRRRFAERFVRTIKESCLDRMILVGEGSLRRAVRAFVEHYHHERNHQGLGNQLIAPVATQTSRDDRIVSRQRLGALLKYYHRPAA